MRRLCMVTTLLLGCGDSGGDGGGTGSATEASGSSAGSTSGAGGSTSGEGSGSASGSSSGAPTTGSMPVDCSSEVYWTQGDHESPLMHPGRACLTCHDTVVGEDIKGRFGIAGTVYPTAHEVDDCNGASGSAGDLKVVITTADNQTLTLPVNGAGNFMYDQVEMGPIMFPIKAKVVRGADELAMATPQTTGDCNSCHTQAGLEGAPGRILAP